jgi:hypothetical protein
MWQTRVQVRPLYPEFGSAAYQKILLDNRIILRYNSYNIKIQGVNYGKKSGKQSFHAVQN